MTSRINLEGVVGVAKVDIGWTAPQTPGGGGGGGTTIHYLIMNSFMNFFLSCCLI